MGAPPDLTVGSVPPPAPVPGRPDPAHESDVLLTDGTTAHVRDIIPGDADALVGFHQGLSTESIVLRFFGPHPRLSPAEVERFTTVDGVDRAALVAERAGQLVAVARYDRTPGRDEAEVAFVVADAYQGRGLGTILLEHLAVIARSHGIRRFVADTLADNHRMLAVLRGAGFARQYRRSSEVVRVVLDIAPGPEAPAAADERDRQAVVASMARLLRPTSIAVVGAARRAGTIGHQLLRNLLAAGFAGPVYPVNPSASSVAGVPCWPDVASIPGTVDLAVVAVPAPVVSSVVEECGRKGVGSLVVISAGFAEAGAGGRDEQRAVTRLAHSYGMRLVGPNCFGVVNTEPGVSMNATFAPAAPVHGPVGFASQSGGLGIAILAEAAGRGIGLSTFVSMGNKADVSSNDLLLWWEQDEATSVALLYLESFGNPRRFGRIAERVSRTKPIVAVKSGRSAAGTRGARSHTAALASPEEAVDALFRRTGVIRVDTIEELFDAAEVLAAQPLPAGGRVGIVGNAGGPGVLAADACAGHGLEVPELRPATQERLRTWLPDGAGVGNPVDMVASAGPDEYARVIELLLEGDEVDAVIAIFTPPLVTRADDVARAVAGASQAAAGWRRGKPVVASFLGAAEAGPVLRAAQPPVPCFTYPETAVRALAHAAAYGRWRRQPAGEVPVLAGTDPNRARQLLEAGSAEHEWLTGAAALEVLTAYGIPVARTAAVGDATAAAEAARSMGGPVALKADGPGLLHKSERGGVRLGLEDPAEVGRAYEEMAAALGDDMSGAVVQAMAGGGVETIAGLVEHEGFGPVVLFGLGGTAVEVLGDHVTRLAPLTDVEAREMVFGLRATPLLTGYRGSTPVDTDALVEVLLRLGSLAADLPEVAEADCNPLVATPDGALVVDARIRVRRDAPEPDLRRQLRS
ncbi:MAG TPA: GNAT family N-acetyltransferase [Acidimicrobiales bacterium]|nr:GNAT family N-acetyltransferase [Acidimicrobiales bacterium]